MSLKDHLKETFNKASLDKDSLAKESIIVKWVHRFGFNSLKDLLSQGQVSKKEEYEEGNQIKIDFKFSETPEYQEKFSLKSINETIPQNEKCINKEDQSCKDKNEYIKSQNLPLPKIDKLRKWINIDKKAS